MKGNLKSLWRHVIPALAVSFALVPAAAEAQDQDERPIVVVQQPEGPPPFANLRGFSSDYKVGPEDLLEIQVVGQQNLTQSLRVSNSGEIGFQMLGRLRVAELTPFEIETELGRQLREKGLVQDAEVLVFVREYHAKPVYVFGAVTTPGEYVMSQDLTVMDALLLAGGLRYNAADEALLHRRVGPEARAWSPAAISETPQQARPGMEIIKIDLRPVKQGHFNETAPAMQRGDVLVVPDQLVHPFFVVGEVIDPRNFSYLPGKTLMASQAISWAGGPLPTAKLSEGMLVRYDADGRRQEMKVDYAAILAGKQADFQIQPNDVIFVPGSKVKTITRGLLSLTDTMVMQASFRIGRSYQMPDPPDNPNRTSGQR